MTAHATFLSGRVLGYRAVQVLEYVRQTIDAEGTAPSYGMIRDKLGFNHKSEVCHIVRRLERRGLLRRVGNERVRRLTSTGIQSGPKLILR